MATSSRGNHTEDGTYIATKYRAGLSHLLKAKCCSVS